MSYVIGTVYLLHFDQAVTGQMQHYVGFTTKSVKSRFNRHTGIENDIWFTKLATKRNIKATVVKTWPEVTAEFEQKLKREKNLKRHCSLCIAKALRGFEA